MDEAAQPLLRVGPSDTPRTLPDLPVRFAALGVFTARLGTVDRHHSEQCVRWRGSLGHWWRVRRAQVGHWRGMR